MADAALQPLNLPFQLGPRCLPMLLLFRPGAFGPGQIGLPLIQRLGAFGEFGALADILLLPALLLLAELVPLVLELAPLQFGRAVEAPPGLEQVFFVPRQPMGLLLKRVLLSLHGGALGRPGTVPAILHALAELKQSAAFGL